MLKPKKVFSIIQIKNEDEIIESFVRYNINIFDGMIFLDNGSTDNTIKILKQLKNEGLLLFILEDNEYNLDKMTQMVLDITNKFKVDVIVPLNLMQFVNILDLKSKVTKIDVNPLDLDFCKSIVTNYSNDKINSTVNLLESYEYLSLVCLNLKKEKFIEEKRLKNKIEELSLEIYEFYNEKISEEKQLKIKIEKYGNELDSQKQSYEEKLGVLDSQKSDLSNKLNNSLIELDSQKQSYEEKLGVLDSQKSDLSNKLNNSLIELDSQKQSYEEKLEVLNDQRIDLSNKLNNLFNRLMSQKWSYEEKLGVLDSQKSDLSNKLNNSLIELDSQKQSYEKLKTTKESYENQINELNTQVVHYHKSINCLQNKNKSLNNESVYLRKELKVIANTKSYRIAYFLRRFSHEFLKGNMNNKKDFLKWVYCKLVRKESGLEFRYNPLMKLVKR